MLLIILQLMPGKATFAKPYHSTTGIPTDVAWWIAGLFALFVVIVTFRVWLSLKKERKFRNTKRQKKTMNNNKSNMEKSPRKKAV